jgi:hypothetical protein
MRSLEATFARKLSNPVDSFTVQPIYVICNLNACVYMKLTRLEPGKNVGYFSRVIHGSGA